MAYQVIAHTDPRLGGPHRVSTHSTKRVAEREAKRLNRTGANGNSHHEVKSDCASAIRSTFPAGGSNAGLRALLKDCRTREDIECVGRKVALTGKGQYALHQLAAAYPAETEE